MMDRALENGIVEYSFHVVHYKDEKEGKKPGKSAPFAETVWKLNPVLGKSLYLTFTGNIRCVDCGRPTKKSFNQGSCYVCFTTLASNDICILKPTLCHYHKGTCREPEWGKQNCFRRHIVYLSITSGAKVGITKEKDPVNRWIDQGAIHAIPLFETESRREAGILEEYISQFVPDTTRWQKMLSGKPETEYDLKSEREKFWKALQSQNLTMIDESGNSIPVRFRKSSAPDAKIEYPVQSPHPTAKSLKRQNNKPLGGRLIGIKGQYLIFDTGVLNLRNLQGYEVFWEIA